MRFYFIGFQYEIVLIPTFIFRSWNYKQYFFLIFHKQELHP